MKRHCPQQGLALLRHMLRQHERGSVDRSHYLRLSCHRAIADSIAAELEQSEGYGNSAGVIQRRRQRGEPGLQHGDRVLGVTVDQVFNGNSEGLAWLA